MDRLLHHICVALALILGKAEASRLNSEQRLVRSLLREYDKIGVYARPVNQPSDIMNVTFSLSLQHIIEFDANLGSTGLKTWHSYSWNDHLLRWDPSDHDGVSTVRLPIHRIWRPDIVLYNRLDAASSEDMDALAVVWNDGKVWWIAQAIDHVPCQQESQAGLWSCEMKFGSWTYDGLNLDLDFSSGSNEIDMSLYTASPQMDVVGASGSRNVKLYSCCPAPYIDLTYTLDLHAK